MQRIFPQLGSGGVHTSQVDYVVVMVGPVVISQGLVLVLFCLGQRVIGNMAMEELSISYQYMTTWGPNVIMMTIWSNVHDHTVNLPELCAGVLYGDICVNLDIRKDPCMHIIVLFNSLLMRGHNHVCLFCTPLPLRRK